MHPRVALQILRHANFKITIEIYTQVTDQQTRNALKRLGESLGWWTTAVLRCRTGPLDRPAHRSAPLTSAFVGRRRHHANQSHVIAGDPLPIRLPRSGGKGGAR